MLELAEWEFYLVEWRVRRVKQRFAGGLEDTPVVDLVALDVAAGVRVVRAWRLPLDFYRVRGYFDQLEVLRGAWHCSDFIKNG